MKKKAHGLKGRPSNARKSEGGRTERLTVRITPELSARLNAAVTPGATLSDVAIAALERGLK